MGDKQTQAVICNFKEQSRLEKALQMLKIEEAYALSLINLDSKVLKIGYKRLKDRVAKTKSHLSNDQINEMKVLEENGEIKEKIIKMESEIRIAAAEKRLKLWSDKKANSVTPRAQTAKSRLEAGESRTSSSPTGSNSLHSTMDMKNIKAVQDMRRKSIDIRDSIDAMEAAFKQMDKEVARSATHFPLRQVSNSSNKFNADETDKPRRKTRVKTDAFMRTADEPVKRQKSIEFRTLNAEKDESLTTADETLQFDKESRPILKHSAASSEPKPAATIKPADMATVEKNPAVPVVSKSATIRPQTGHPSLRSRKSFLKKRPATSLINASRDRSHDRRLSQLITRTPFSSHDLGQVEKKSVFDTPFRSIREGTLTAHDKKTIDKDMGEEIYKAIKKEFLRKEAATSLHTENKIDTFFEKVDEYIHEKDKSKDRVHEIKIPVPIFSKAARDDRKSSPRRNHLRRRELELAIHNDVTNERLHEVIKSLKM